MAKSRRNRNVVKFNEVNENDIRTPEETEEFLEVDPEEIPKPKKEVDIWEIAKGVGYFAAAALGAFFTWLILNPKKDDESSEIDSENLHQYGNDDGTVKTITTDPLTESAMAELGLKPEDVTI